MSSFLVRIIVLAVVVLVLVPACVRAVNEGWEQWKHELARDAPGFVQWLLCKVVRMEAACTVLQMSQAPDAASQRRIQCIERKIAEHPRDAANVRSVCGLRTDPEAWEACVKREFDKVPALQGELIECSAYSPTQMAPFWRDVIEPIACPLGITSWCQTSREEPYVYHRGYLQCLSDAVKLEKLDAKACAPLKDPRAWDACMAGVLGTHPDARGAQKWIKYCEQVRSQPSKL
jgi:hypothetical protein